MFSGHGNVVNGAWTFQYGELLTPGDFFDIVEEVEKTNTSLAKVGIHSDSCYSGNWCNDVKYYKHLRTQIKVCAAVAEDERAKDNKYGGLFT